MNDVTLLHDYKFAVDYLYHLKQVTANKTPLNESILDVNKLIEIIWESPLPLSRYIEDTLRLAQNDDLTPLNQYLSESGQGYYDVVKFIINDHLSSRLRLLFSETVKSLEKEHQVNYKSPINVYHETSVCFAEITGGVDKVDYIYPINQNNPYTTVYDLCEAYVNATTINDEYYIHSGIPGDLRPKVYLPIRFETNAVDRDPESPTYLYEYHIYPDIGFEFYID